ncbi:phage portal protein [Pseudonocardia sp. KRD-184]|uniref:Phage portal protein n=1 Tax=Pseudonocardia oceani TaxID=2792013 RepID=A0ABS6UG32_9PSEU|nr:phage portal protein [Pseudonocardia oceani]MBW0088243.1 phage portal protein [Pseudonocardia oceani]MBW0095025.1 phage portal protein [Pseudonocardia oceani]MBW0121122.1 phage portal protein [Pseudonocardia oceani]MBW0131192.1 phage portal protein [Pseudonocardia oceani]MBW0132641.1 phage portal protein [Pseudonocardia oceani]
MAFAISGGRVNDAYKPTGAVSTSLRLTDTATVAYQDLWKTQPHIRTVVSFLARNVAQLGLHTYRRVSDLDRERVTDHPLAQLLAQPNPYTTPYRFTEALVSDLAIYDNAILLKVKLPEQPMALLRLDPARVTPTGTNPFVPTGYLLGKQSFKPEDIIHFRGYSPVDARWGMSPMETLRNLLSEEHQATLYREQLWRNGARISGYLQRPADAPSWTSPAKERFRSQWQAQYSGDGSRPGGTPILEDGMTYVPAATSPRDAQYIESRKLTREEVTAAYHVPLPLVGILDHATYSNIVEQHKMLYQDCLGPYLQMIQQELALQLMPDFPDSDDLYIEFNLSEKLRGSFEEQAAQLQTAVGSPWMTRNEARARVNLPQVDGGDELVTPLNVTAGGQASPTDSAPPPIEAGSARALRAVEG